MPKDYYTTFEVGELCQVYHTTVINWVNKKQLKAYKTPGKHRRILRSDLIEFMKKFNIPIPAELLGLKKKVLAVDDDPAVLKLFQKAFSRLPSVQLQTTLNGVEALVSVGKQIPDLMILDVVMPGMDGIQVCRTLRSNPDTRDIKTIVVTGKNLSDDQQKFLDENVDAILAKPFSPLSLIEKSRSLLSLETPQRL
jgi:excisionase family DNA binding protein